MIYLVDEGKAGRAIYVVYLDFSEAFDAIFHSILPEKCSSGVQFAG